MDISTFVGLAVRAAKHPKDYLTVLQTHELIFEKSIRESDSVYSFYFTSKKSFRWRSGQHGIFTLTAKESSGDPRRVFSIASSVTEGHVHIATVISKDPSLFKAQLKTLQPGSSICMRGPIGEFHLPKKPTHIIGVAGGIGITPFRAIIKEMIDTQRTDIKIDLLYGCASHNRTFELELAEWSKQPNITVFYPASKEDLQSQLRDKAISFRNTAQYYISGSPNMIEELRSLLAVQGITNIINDPFKGY